MSQFPHDEFAKNLFELLLTPFGGVEIERGVQPEAKAVDIYFQPSKPLPHDHNIGLLARCITQPAIGNTLDLFLSLKLELESKQSIEPEERNLAMRLSALYIEKIQEAQQVGEARGRQEGRTEEGQALILRLLTRRVGNVPMEAEIRVKALPLERLEDLGEALLDFTQIGDLLAWLDLESQ